MAIKKIKIGNTTHDIQDGRIVGVTSTVSSGNGSVVTSGGVYNALSFLNTGINVRGIATDGYVSKDVIWDSGGYNGWKNFIQQLGLVPGSDVESTKAKFTNLFKNRPSVALFKDGLGTLIDFAYSAPFPAVLANNLAYISQIHIDILYGVDEVFYMVFESASYRLTLMYAWDDDSEEYVYAWMLGRKQNILFFHLFPLDEYGYFNFENWDSENRQWIAYDTLEAIERGEFDRILDLSNGIILNYTGSLWNHGIFSSESVNGQEFHYSLRFGPQSGNRVYLRLSENVIPVTIYEQSASESDIQDELMDCVVDIYVPNENLIYFTEDDVFAIRWNHHDFMQIFESDIVDYIESRLNIYPTVYAVYYDVFSTFPYDDTAPTNIIAYVLLKDSITGKFFWVMFEQ